MLNISGCRRSAATPPPLIMHNANHRHHWRLNRDLPATVQSSAVKPFIPAFTLRPLDTNHLSWTLNLTQTCDLSGVSSWRLRPQRWWQIIWLQYREVAPQLEPWKLGDRVNVLLSCLEGFLMGRITCKWMQRTQGLPLQLGTVLFNLMPWLISWT